MKFHIYASVIASLLIVSSCSSDEIEVIKGNEFKKITLGVRADNSNITRIYSEELGTRPMSIYNLYWNEENEHINVYAQDVPTPCKFDQTGRNVQFNYATFTNSQPFDDAKDNYYVMYPAQDNSILSSSSKGIIITATIPQEQKAEWGSFDPSAVIQVGKLSKDKNTGSFPTNVDLKNVCAFLEFEIGEGIKSIEISAKNDPNWKVSGRVDLYEISSGSAKVDFLTNQKAYENYQFASVKLLPAAVSTTDDGCFKKGYYLLAVASSTTFPGLKITVKDKNNVVKSYSSSDAYNFNAGNVYFLGSFPKK